MAQWRGAKEIEQYAMAQLCRLGHVMKAAPMGAGTVSQHADYGCSEVAEPAQHIMTNYHMLLLGKGGGKFGRQPPCPDTHAQSDGADAHDAAGDGHERDYLRQLGQNQQTVPEILV